MRVDFSSRNPYSDGAEWKWRLKDKDDHVIEGARERFGKVGKVIGEILEISRAMWELK